MQIDSDNSRGGRGPVWRGGGRSSGRSGGRSGGATANVPCRFFLEGKCERGDACNFLHNIDPGAVANGRKRISERGPAAHDPRPGASFGGGRNGPGPSGSAFDRLGGQSPFDRLGGGAPQTPAAGSGYGAYGGGGMQNGGQGGRGQQARFGRRGGGAGRSGPQQQKRGVCRYWLGGSCRNGANCNFLHVHATAPDVDLMTELKGHEKVRTVVNSILIMFSGLSTRRMFRWVRVLGAELVVCPNGGNGGTSSSIR